MSPRFALLALKVVRSETQIGRFLRSRSLSPDRQGNRKVGTDHSFSWRMKGFNSIQLRCMPMNGVDSPPRHSDD